MDTSQSGNRHPRHRRGVFARQVTALRRLGARRAVTMLAALAGVSTILVMTATAAPPSFPNNLIVFPDRDFLSAEGFQDHVGETALVDVTRPGVGVVGSAEVVIGPGDVPFEVNHPGGYCWGRNTNLNVTPDIIPGDVVALHFGDGTSWDTTAGDAYVTGVNYTPGSDTFTVVGHIGPSVDPANTEQRIVNPALTDTAVGRRDIRAVPGPLTADRNGQYQSSLAFSGTSFTATYVFLDPAVAEIAATGGGERLLSWQVTDAANNRQAITIAEFGELGGPGMGGCPNGPLASGPQGPTGVTAIMQGGNLKVAWTPAVAIPGTPPITGYRVTAVAQSSTGGEQVELGRRISGQAASSTTITGLASGETYDVEIVSISSAGATFPAIHATPGVDTTPPTVAVDPPGGSYATSQSVRLSANEPNAQIFYTLDGTSPLDGPDQLSATAVHYTGPINVAATTTVKAVAFDLAGLASDVLTATYTIDGGAVAPGAPTIDSAVAGVGAVTLQWSLDSAYVVTDFTVRVNNADGTLRGDVSPNPIVTTAHQATVTGLQEGTPYYFTVTARNDNGSGPASAQAGPVTPLGTVVANAGPDRSVTRGLTPTTVQLAGTGSTTGAGVTYQWQQVGASAADTVTIANATSINASFQLPLFRFPATNSALTFRLAVTSGGVTRTDDVKITPVPGDTVTVTRAQWKAGDFRVDGTGSVDGAEIRVHSGSLGGPTLGVATVTAGGWSLRLRGGAAPASRPVSVWVESTVGATAGPITVN